MRLLAHLLRLTLLTVALTSTAGPAAAQHSEHLHCEIRYASQTWQLDVNPTDEPLSVQPSDVGGRFAFRAFARRHSDGIGHITTQVFDLEADQAPMVQQFQRAAPWPSDPEGPSLTGWQQVYSTRLGRELVYGCAVRPGPAPGVADVAVLQPAPVPGMLPPLWRPGPVPGTVAGHDDTSPSLTLAFVGDVMLADGPGRVIASGRDPFADVAERLRQADVRIGNLECVVAHGGHALDKPWTFRAHPSVLPLLKRHLDVVSLANNHAGDYGREAFAEMLGHLARAGLPTIGGGRNLREAHRPLIIERKGVRIALLGYNEFFPRNFEAGIDHPGSAWSDDEQVVADIRRARTEDHADLVIPFMHWGTEGETVANDFVPRASQS